LEHDTSRDLDHFRRGLLKVVKAVGVTKLADEIGLSRISLYRMLKKGGNPRLDSLLSVFKALGIHFWIVDDDFKNARERVVRPKDVKPVMAIPKTIRRPGHQPKSL
jgi:probable addiction module antidote protein